MKAKFTCLALTSLCISSFTGNVIAEEYRSVQTPSGGYVTTSDNSGYYSSGSGYPAQQGTQVPSGGYPAQQGTQVPSGGYPAQQGTQVPSPPPQVHQPVEHHHKKEKSKFSFAINLPIQNETIVITDRGHKRHHDKAPFWIGMRTGAPIPSDAVVGGGQPVPPATLFVCRASYRGGMHPGKLFNGRCHISWGGSEVVMSHYEVLVSRGHLRWLPGSYGSIPSGAIEGGYQHDRPLFICQADYNGGTHIGKIVGQNCNFGWGGREVLSPYYNVLVR